MKEDVLEQIVDDYLQFQGYFTTHNVRFRPSPEYPDHVPDQDRVFSDVDVVGFHPQPPAGTERVVVVSCKSWQPGFAPAGKLAELRGEKANPKRETWRHFRELWAPKWSEALHAKIGELTGESTFAYRIAVTRLRGEGTAEDWATDPTIAENLRGCSFDFLTLEEMLGNHARGAHHDARLERDRPARPAAESSRVDRVHCRGASQPAGARIGCGDR